MRECNSSYIGATDDTAADDLVVQHTYQENSFAWRSSASRRTLTVDQRVVGRLGNSMFQYASLVGLAMSMGYKPVLLERAGQRASVLYDYFKLTVPRANADPRRKFDVVSAN